MSKNTTIALIIFFVLVLIGLSVYGVLILFNSTAQGSTSKGGNTNTNNSNTNGNPPVTSQSDMDNFVKRFRDGFEAYHDLYRCDLISEALTFDNTQLQNFADTYRNTYGITVVQQMDKVWIWCFSRTTGQTLYDKLKAL
ncbi:hypothetical protein [Aureispira sp. CCB-QB1]|uniref:hypothetical protein n=1 Tax=Aureispira sp. CCB-QB1 TaxID=1313421 RepID=UPI000695BBA8|nr:hypothetical protein [Aureispira sp. CCB-QB1]